MWIYQLSGTEEGCPLYEINFYTPLDALKHASEKFFLRNWKELKKGKLWQIVTGNRIYRIELKKVNREN